MFRNKDEAFRGELISEVYVNVSVGENMPSDSSSCVSSLSDDSSLHEPIKITPVVTEHETKKNSKDLFFTNETKVKGLSDDHEEENEQNLNSYLPSFWGCHHQEDSKSILYRQHSHHFQHHQSNSNGENDSNAHLQRTSQSKNLELRMTNLQLPENCLLLLGERPRHKRSPKSGKRSLSVSVGSLVGQSTITTTVVTDSESVSTELSLSNYNTNEVITSNQQHLQLLKEIVKRRKKVLGKVLKSEIRYVWNALKTPVRKIVKGNKVSLHRSSKAYYA